MVAHPDDEAIFFGDWLLENAHETKVVSLTASMDYNIWHKERHETRYYEFQNCMKRAGVKYFECLGMETPTLNPLQYRDDYKNVLKRISWETDWQQIVTHNRHGESGHIQHVETHELVRDIFPKDKIYVYKNSKENDLKLTYGLRLTVCADMLTKDEESLSTNCKYIFFITRTRY